MVTPEIDKQGRIDIWPKVFLMKRISNWKSSYDRLSGF
ncbi:hypothetical protein [uncultured Desulfobacter sp.]